VQPVFTHRHIQSFAPAIITAARKRFDQWTPGGTVDVAAEIGTLTMDVVGSVLFGTDLAGDAASVWRAVTRLQSLMAVAAIVPAFLPLSASGLSPPGSCPGSVKPRGRWSR
jgi:cytochrome P450